MPVIPKQSEAWLMDERRRVILLPVRRRLAVLACAYLTGVYLAQIAAFPAVWIGFLCAFSAVLGLFRLRRRKSALFVSYWRFSCSATA